MNDKEYIQLLEAQLIEERKFGNWYLLISGINILLSLTAIIITVIKEIV